MGTSLDFDMFTKQRYQKLQNLTASGQTLVGYIYPHLPLELLLAHQLIPVLLWADPQISGGYEASLQTFCCAYSRNLFSQRAQGKFASLAALIFPGGTCDSLQNLADIWRARYPNDVVIRLTYPVGRGEAAVNFLTQELEQLSNTFQLNLGTKFSMKQYEKAVALVADFRAAAQFITAARLLQPNLLSYADYTGLLRAFLTEPESHSLAQIEQTVTQVQNEIRNNQRAPITEALRYGLLHQQLSDIPFTSEEIRPRILLLGGMIDPEGIALLFENAKSGTNAENAEIVLDVLSFSFRMVFTQSPSFQGNPYQELAKAIIKAPTEPTQEGFPERLAFIETALKHLQIDGVIIAEQSFCDPDQFEVPAILALTEKEKIPIVRLPLDPEFSDRSRLEGRLQSFLETITK